MTRSLHVNRDIILATKRQHNQERQRITPVEAMRALAQTQRRPRYMFEKAAYEKRVVVIGQVTRTPTYDPVTAALQYVDEGADAIAFFTDHSIYDNDFDDMLMVARAISHVPVFYQNYIIDEYSVMTARASDASGLMIYSSLLQGQMLRRVVSMTQRWKMTTVLQGSQAAQLAEQANALSPHVVALGDHMVDTAQDVVGELATLRQMLPFHTRLMVAPCLQTLDEVEVCAAAGVSAVIVGEALLKHSSKAAKMRQILKQD